MKTWLKKGTWLKSAALLALPVALLLVILGGTLNANPASAQDANTGSVATDRAALVALYHATGGNNWTNNTNWLSDQPVGVWHGVTTRINDGRVTRLDLSENNLSGRIPAELEGLKLLIELSLHRNELTGQIPSQLANLENLQQLHLSRNQLTGEIPAFLGGMTSLSRLHLNHNGFTGAVPAELGNRTTLTSLLLQSNPGLNGKLPQSLTGMTGLNRFHFQDTGLCYPNGTNLATWIAGVRDAKGNDCDRAALVALYHATNGDNWHTKTNWLSDRPVGEWHGVTFTFDGTSRVFYLVLSNNNLSGTIPAELSDLTELGLLNFSGNNLTGEIPPELGNTSVIQLSLNDNNLSGRLPSELFEDRVYPAYPHRFRDLELRNNSGLTGPLPRSLMDANPAYTLLFDGTSLCAPGDAEFQTWLNNPLGPGENRVTLDQNCTDRQILTAFYEDTDGPNWTNKANWLSERPIGEWHGVTTNDAGRVTHLNLAENNLTGELPDYLASLTELTELALHRNNLSGSIPTQLTQFERLENFYLSRNKLTGELPAGLSDMENLSRLHLNNNGFTGAVPASLGNLSNLTSLLLYGNTDLSGDLPQSLTGLSNVWRIHFQDTGLCAPLNPGFQQWLGNVSDKIGDNCANRDREALVALYNATGGANWTNNANWLSDRPVGEWYGVSTDANGNVKHILLFDNNLNGSIPAEIGDFANLKNLALYGNTLKGSIPAEVGNLTSLTRIALSGNSLNGEAPAELGNLTNLTHLSLDSNPSLSGTLPTSLTALEILEEFRYEQTGLCAPYDYQFLQWLEGLDLHLGEVCAPASDKDVLTLLYHATDGDNWINKSYWLSARPLGEWHGVATNDDGRVDFIGLLYNNLSGEIPSRLSDLSELKHLILQGNHLTGEIPSELSNLGKLQELWLNNNSLTGEIPPELGNVDTLRKLYVHYNDLSGSVPESLGSARDLVSLVVRNNTRLTGPLPISLTEKSTFFELFFQETEVCAPQNDQFQTWLQNSVIGYTPNQNCTDRQILTALYQDTGGANWTLKNNWLSEKPVNDWYGVHAKADGRVRRIDLSLNNLSGELPAYVASLTELTGLWINDNSALSGPLPQSLTGMSKLTSLRFNSTGLCAPLNDEFQQWLGGVAEKQGSNCPEREYLVSLYNATNGENWTNNTNWLSDKPISEWHGVTTDGDGRVTRLILRDNNLSGELPPAVLSKMTSLERLVLPNNALTGSIPEELAELTNLRRLNLTGNSLSGTIPTELGSLSNLERIYLDGNDLTGGIPAELGNLGALQILILTSNKLTGEIPVALGSLSALQHLILTGNSGLNGGVPTELGNLSNLRQLYLSHTGLSGVLPNSLTGLSQLEHLQFGDSGLCAPADAGFQTWLKGLSGAQSNFVTLDQNCTDRQILTALYHATGGANWTHKNHWLSERPVGDWYGVHTNADRRVRRIDSGRNNLTGELPAYVASLTELDGLWIHENSLTGELPQSLTGLPKMTNFRFNNSGLCAPLNDEFQQWLNGVSEKQGSNCTE